MSLIIVLIFQLGTLPSYYYISLYIILDVRFLIFQVSVLSSSYYMLFVKKAINLYLRLLL